MKTRNPRAALLVVVSLLLGGLLLADPPEIAATRIECRFSPHGGCADEVVQRIDAAKKTIHVRAYGFTSQPIGEALVRACERGVSVYIVCDRSERTDKYSQAPACRNAGAEVLFDESHPISHSKVIVIDGRLSLLGSYNWTKQAEANAETLLTIESRDLAKALLTDFAKHHEHALK